MSDKTYDTTIVKFANDGNGNLKLIGLYDNDISAACDKVTTVPDSFPSLGKIRDNGEIELDKEADLADAVSKLKSENEDNFNAIGFNDAGEEDEDEKEDEKEDNKNDDTPSTGERVSTETSPGGEEDEVEEAPRPAPVTDERQNKAALINELTNKLESKKDEVVNTEVVNNFDELKSRWLNYISELQDVKRNSNKTENKLNLANLEKLISGSTDMKELDENLKEATISGKIIKSKYNYEVKDGKRVWRLPPEHIEKGAGDQDTNKKSLLKLTGGKKTVRKYKLKRTQNKRSNKRRTKKYNK